MTHINLFSVTSLRKRLVVNAARFWTKVLAILLVFLGTTTWIIHRKSKTLSNQIEILNSENDAEQQRRQQMAELSAEIEALRERETLTLNLASEQSVLTMLGILSDAQSKGNGGIFVESLKIMKKPTAQVADNQNYLLEIMGVNDLVIATFVAALRDHEVFEKVELKSTGGKPLGERLLRSYRLECSF